MCWQSDQKKVTCLSSDRDPFCFGLVGENNNSKLAKRGSEFNSASKIIVTHEAEGVNDPRARTVQTIDKLNSLLVNCLKYLDS